uniref:Sugar phosphate transporter domain-containing protein n=1 Tax=Trichogramma kaykai TaxID=54128 RepID=A0ABD2WQ43_9HYME
MENQTAYYTQVTVQTDEFAKILPTQPKYYHENAEKKHPDDAVLASDTKGGLANPRAILFLVLWYIFSGFTLFLNKYILTYMQGDPTVLGACQMFMTAICGFIQMYFPCGMYKANPQMRRPPGFYKHMTLVGCMRFSTVVLGLISLNYVAVSFTETIKSSAPLFTVLISRYLLGEQTGLYVNLSLIPVMGGLALCSANEISFNSKGFIAALATNLTECLQNVYSKMLISGANFKYTPAELQFYTSLASIVVQIPVSILFVDYSTIEHSLELHLLAAFLLNGIFFHFQSITAYVLMDYISPVTHSKKGIFDMAIHFIVQQYGHWLISSGDIFSFRRCTAILYNKAKEYDNQKKKRRSYPLKVNVQ